MNDTAVFYVEFAPHPCQLRSYGVCWDGSLAARAVARGQRREIIPEAQWNELANSDEPSRLIAAWFGLRYQKYITPVEPAINVVEIVAGENAGYDQSCRFGDRVEGHAVYCHNEAWVDAPRKCHRSWSTGGKVPDESCPGFEARR